MYSLSFAKSRSVPTPCWDATAGDVAVKAAATVVTSTSRRETAESCVVDDLVVVWRGEKAMLAAGNRNNKERSFIMDGLITVVVG
jgi:hypothetical protein